MVGGAVLLLGFLPRSYRVALSHASLVPRIGCVTQVCAAGSPLVSKWHVQPVRALHHTPSVCAGHNKWSKVKDVKIPRDAARARMMQKLSMMIRVAVRGKYSCCSLFTRTFTVCFFSFFFCQNENIAPSLKRTQV